MRKQRAKEKVMKKKLRRKKNEVTEKQKALREERWRSAEITEFRADRRTYMQ